MKKTLLTCLPLTLVLVLSACANSEKESNPTSGDDSGDYFIKEATSISFTNTFSYTTIIEQFIEEFKQIEPNVTVTNNKLTGGYPDMQSQTISDFSTGEYGDLVVGYPDNVVAYMDYNKVVKLDDYMNNEKYGLTRSEKNDYVQTYLEEGTAYPLSGTYSVPFAKSSECMYYNASALINLNLRKYDATINNGNPLTANYLNNLTWDELFDHLCPAIIAYNNDLPVGEKILNTSDTYGVIGYDSDDNLFITLAEQYGYGYTAIDDYGEGSLLWNNENMKGLMKKLNVAHRNHYLFTKQTNDGKAYVNTFFTAGKTLFSVGSTGGFKYQHSDTLTMEVGCAPIPQADVNNKKIISQGPNVCVLSHGDDNRALAAWLFYKFMTNTTNSARWAVATGYSPVRTSVYTSRAYAEYCDYESIPDTTSIDYLAAINAQYIMSVDDYLFYSPAFKGSAASRTNVGALLATCVGATEQQINDANWLTQQFDTAENNTKKNM